MTEIRNILLVAEGLYCAGQPTEDQLEQVKALDVELIVNLAMSDSDAALPDERRSVEALGMRFEPIPVPFDAPTVQHFMALERILLAPRARGALVHCAYNWRATSFVALFCERNLGWSRSQSEALRQRFWMPNGVWAAWASEVKRLPRVSVEALR